MTPTLNEGRPNWCFGLNSMQLAFALRVGSEELFEHNALVRYFLSARTTFRPLAALVRPSGTFSKSETGKL